MHTIEEFELVRSGSTRCWEQPIDPQPVSRFMNATPFSDFRTAALSASQSDEKMDQIRELLFGEYHRQNEARFALMEARVRELELAVHHRIDAIQGRVEQIVGQTTADQRATLDELAHGLAELGDRVRRIR
jgi:hypothetical protein